ncbi:glycosyltransferase family 2 protein [Pseudomonas sp. RIT-PI-S]|uniref:glycosyltransferase family 2 protein n=1 Tax=Pseudomonas sp. RIT-PI-S TaxID=3035295 RepID=UPI0021DB703D|nr:glycosyltransferase family 2 protein [Pseudomonas sp. RIT-PI-S]
MTASPPLVDPPAHSNTPSTHGLHVITLVHGRRAHLDNLIRALEHSTLLPLGLWIIHMNEPAAGLHSDRFVIHEQVLEDAQGLPLARARNAILTVPVGGPWVFIDVDCIPSERMLEHYQAALQAHPHDLHLGAVRYLPEGANAPGWNEASLLAQSIAHPLSVYRGDPGDELEHSLFWSLNFACTRELFERIGGFDEGYTGYGAEDTDFAFRAQDRKVPLRVTDALAFHQYHPTYSPPLNHFEDIISNARRFHQRWKVWPMEGWLRSFAERGLVHWEGEALEVLRTPGTDEVQACFNTARQGF